jgi:hypothetical protein
MTDLDSFNAALPPEASAVPPPAEAGLGHNNPPDPPLYDPAVHAAMVAKVTEFTDAAGAWLDLQKIETTEQAERLNDFLTGSRKVRKSIEDARAAAKNPWQQKADFVYSVFNDLVLKMSMTLDLLTPLAADWLKRENARLAEVRRQAADEANRLRDEAEQRLNQARLNNDVSGMADAEKAVNHAANQERQAAKPVAAKIASATGAGRSIGLRTQKTVEILNINLLFLHFRDRPEVAEVLQKLAQAEVRAASWDGVDPPGTKVTFDQVAA